MIGQVRVNDYPAGARNRRKASVKIRRNPSHHQTEQVQIFSILKQILKMAKEDRTVTTFSLNSTFFFHLQKIKSANFLTSKLQNFESVFFSRCYCSNKEHSQRQSFFTNFFLACLISVRLGLVRIQECPAGLGEGPCRVLADQDQNIYY